MNYCDDVSFRCDAVEASLFKSDLNSFENCQFVDGLKFGSWICELRLNKMYDRLSERWVKNIGFWRHRERQNCKRFIRSNSQIQIQNTIYRFIHGSLETLTFGMVFSIDVNQLNRAYTNNNLLKISAISWDCKLLIGNEYQFWIIRQIRFIYDSVVLIKTIRNAEQWDTQSCAVRSIIIWYNNINKWNFDWNHSIFLILRFIFTIFLVNAFDTMTLYRIVTSNEVRAFIEYWKR